VTLGQRLAAESAAVGRTLQEASKQLLAAMGDAAGVWVSRAAEGLRGAVEAASAGERAGAGEGRQPGEPPEPPLGPEVVSADVSSGEAVEAAAEAPARRSKARDTRREARRTMREKRARQAETKPKQTGVGRAILAAIVLLIAGNLCMLTVEMPTGQWHIYEQGWPIELFLVSWGLCVIMYVASSIWMLIPVGLTLGTGMLLAYSSLTGNWQHWDFLWIFEVWIALGSIVTPIFLSRNKELARGLSRVLAVLLSLVSVGWIVGVGQFATWSVRLGGLLTGLRSLILR